MHVSLLKAEFVGPHNHMYEIDPPHEFCDMVGATYRAYEDENGTTRYGWVLLTDTDEEFSMFWQRYGCRYVKTVIDGDEGLVIYVAE